MELTEIFSGNFHKNKADEGLKKADWLLNLSVINSKKKKNMNTILLFNFFGPEMLVVMFAILLLFGGKKIPELMRGIGKGIREFNSARSTIESELKEGMRESDKKLEEESKEK
jgi:sec-independent protein translocase protein TatA